MAMNEERLKVLKMIQEGKLTPDEGLQLLEALDEAPRPDGPEIPTAKTAGPTEQTAPARGRWFRVRVTDTNSGKSRANVRLPLSMVNAGLKMGMKFTPEIQGMDMDKLAEFIRAGETGQLVDVYDDEGSEHVEVYIE